MVALEIFSYICLYFLLGTIVISVLDRVYNVQKLDDIKTFVAILIWPIMIIGWMLINIRRSILKK